ncbi:putative colanic acid biosynthesis glycosyltransferase [Paenibacillus sp. UNC496MF]|uniref:glycosyltransferase n=1 Tax=Paenibacillus sp. UNC496MF TaxID=1502753 RepID=UPI0008E4BCB1|nr:glycosyltransferase [Paenibacillus sp. UNC496MF]SFI88184.1 putative colanic acid biosynthesis glycosyltransferase [Paenibacillus sp. UNC496MF]
MSQRDNRQRAKRKKPGESPFLSVITVCLNNLDGLRKTKDSLGLLSCRYEWIVIDGMSTDGTVAYLETLDQDNVNWVSERDRGLYDAMNKGIARSSGTYVIFINSGDEIAGDWSASLPDEAQREGMPDLIYGDSYERTMENKLLYKKARSHRWLWYGMFTHHQAMLYKRSAISQTAYQAQYPVGADYAFTAEVLLKRGRAMYVPAAVCIFEQGGISSKQRLQGRLDQWNIRKDIIKMPFVQRWSIRLFHDASFLCKSRFPFVYRKLRFKSRISG